VHLLNNWGLRMLEPVEQFRAALAGRGILPKDGEVIADGRIHRCDAEGRGGKGDAAYLLHLDGIPAGGFETGAMALAGRTGGLNPPAPCPRRKRLRTAPS
jgi:hypothetical protein